MELICGNKRPLGESGEKSIAAPAASYNKYMGHYRSEGLFKEIQAFRELTSAGADTVSNYYWSATTYKSSTTNAWNVNFNNGNVNNNNKTTNLNYARCVRGQLIFSRLR